MRAGGCRSIPCRVSQLDDGHKRATCVSVFVCVRACLCACVRARVCTCPPKHASPRPTPCGPQLDEGYLSPPEAVEFPTEGGRTAYMNYYPPRWGWGCCFKRLGGGGSTPRGARRLCEYTCPGGKMCSWWLGGLVAGLARLVDGWASFGGLGGLRAPPLGGAPPT